MILRRKGAAINVCDRDNVSFTIFVGEKVKANDNTAYRGMTGEISAVYTDGDCLSTDDEVNVEVMFFPTMQQNREFIRNTKWEGPVGITPNYHMIVMDIEDLSFTGEYYD
jgi:hypothetical protein